MAKEDIGELPAPPTKRRQLERALDVHIAMWLDSDDLTPSQRKKIEEEKQARKETRAREDNPVGLLVPIEGATPQQVEAIEDALRAASPTEIHHPGVDRAVHSKCRSIGVAVLIHRNDPKEVVRASSLVIGAVKETTEPINKTGVWDLVKYAKHRRLPVKVILPSGDELSQE